MHEAGLRGPSNQHAQAAESGKKFILCFSQHQVGDKLERGPGVEVEGLCGLHSGRRRASGQAFTLLLWVGGGGTGAYSGGP